ncbi:UNVERIFIED_CONTAM: hypothetical protein Sindi_2418100 [Sesamum indicum]
MEGAIQWMEAVVLLTEEEEEGAVLRSGLWNSYTNQYGLTLVGCLLTHPVTNLKLYRKSLDPATTWRESIDLGWCPFQVHVFDIPYGFHTLLSPWLRTNTLCSGVHYTLVDFRPTVVPSYRGSPLALGRCGQSREQSSSWEGVGSSSTTATIKGTTIVFGGQLGVHGIVEGERLCEGIRLFGDFGAHFQTILFGCGGSSWSESILHSKPGPILSITKTNANLMDIPLVQLSTASPPGSYCPALFSSGILLLNSLLYKTNDIKQEERDDSNGWYFVQIIIVDDCEAILPGLMNRLIWNCQGIGRLGAIRQICEMVRSHDPVKVVLIKRNIANHNQIC